jgi:NAD dependent epimerase/dehydratase family enzyme
MRTLIIGATGFIGRQLMKELSDRGHMPVAVTRNALKARQIFGDQIEIAEWDGQSAASLAGKLAGIDSIVNLAGENIAAGRWTKKRIKKLTDSRVITGRLVTEAVKIADSRPSVLIQGSATGFYGTPAAIPVNENCHHGSGFLAKLSLEWESAVGPAGKTPG